MAGIGWWHFCLPTVADACLPKVSIANDAKKYLPDTKLKLETGFPPTGSLAVLRLACSVVL